MLRFPQRIPGLHEGESPAGQVVIFGAGIIRNSSAIQQCSNGPVAVFPEEKKNSCFENS
jgi:hypothetical protein